MTSTSMSILPSEENRPPLQSLAERENLLPEVTPKSTGFTPRPQEKLAIRRLPRSTTNIECAHFLRTATTQSATGHDSVEYQLWMEAGKHDPPIPQRPDNQYNANVWRNFRRAYGFHVNSAGQKVSEMIANMYPLNIPHSSQIGEYTYSKFLRETPLIKDDRRRQYTIDKTARDILEFKRLRLKSDMRNPPLDQSGKIVPPVKFKYYSQRFIPPPGYSDAHPLPPPPPTSQKTRIDVFGQEVPVAKEPHLWKLKHKLNHPQYTKVKEEMERRKALPTPTTPYLTFATAY